MNPYCYPPTNQPFNLQLKENNGKWVHYSVDFPIAVPTSHKEHNIALGEYYQPCQGNNWPMAILVHGWGDRSLAPCQLLAKDLVKSGIASFVLRTVFHSSRMAGEIKSRLPKLTADEWFEGYQTSVIDIRQIADWAHDNKQINRDQIAIIGMSLGGIVAAISMAVDKRIQAGIILISGGNYENPGWLKKTGNKRTEAEYIEGQKLYANYLDEVAQKGFENVEPAKRSYLTDPVTFASYLRNRPVLMINAMLDERIPRQSTIDLWEASGKPDIKWLPGTHSSIWLLYPQIRKQVLDFLNATFRI
jgi:predicted esterase